MLTGECDGGGRQGVPSAHHQHRLAHISSAQPVDMCCSASMRAVPLHPTATASCGSTILRVAYGVWQGPNPTLPCLYPFSDIMSCRVLRLCRCVSVVDNHVIYLEVGNFPSLCVHSCSCSARAECSACVGRQTLCIEGHNMTIVAADAVPTKLLTVTCLDVNLGQRCAQSFRKVSCCRVQTFCRVQTLSFAYFRQQHLSPHRTLMCQPSRYSWPAWTSPWADKAHRFPDSPQSAQQCWHTINWHHSFYFSLRWLNWELFVHMSYPFKTQTSSQL